MSVISARIRTTDAAFEAVRTLFFDSRYAERRLVPAICDFTLGNPHEMPLAGVVTAIRERAIPHDKNWFAYKASEAKQRSMMRWAASRDSKPVRGIDPIPDRPRQMATGSGDDLSNDGLERQFRVFK
jgi:hypothetical protein